MGFLMNIERKWRLWIVCVGIAAASAAIPVGIWNVIARHATPPMDSMASLQPNMAPAATEFSTHAGGAPRLEDLVERLASRLHDRTPADGQGWALLGRTYAELGRYPDAVDAFARAVKLVPDDATVVADYRKALAMVRQGSAAGRAR
jgi:cytochrome c-type biogenesis protein CcmH/NrfG